MKYFLFVICLIFVFSCTQKNTKQEFNYPKINIKDTVSETIWGTTVIDAYRGLENAEDSLNINWYKQQQAYTKGYLQQINNHESLLDALRSFDQQRSFVTSSLRITDTDRYFYLKKEAGQNIKKLYYRQGFTGAEIVLYDPKVFKPETEDTYLINYIGPNHKGDQVVIGLTKNGEEFSEMVILDVATKTLLSDHHIDHCWPSELSGVQWLPDDSGFFYSHIPVIDKQSKTYLAESETRLYTLQGSPKVTTGIFSKKHNSTLDIAAEDFPITYLWEDCTDYVFGRVGGARLLDDFYYSKFDGTTSSIEWKPLYTKEDKVRHFRIVRDSIVFMTAKGASNYKICKTALDNPNFDTPSVLIPEDSTSVITRMELTKHGLYFVRTKNGVDARLYRWVNGKEEAIPIPKPSGYIGLHTKGITSDALWITIKGWTHKKERYRFDVPTQQFVLESLHPIVEYPELKDVVIQEIEVPSHDGTLVPLSIVYKKGALQQKDNRVLIDGYGAYGVSDIPVMRKVLVQWIANGGIYVNTHVRGGGEKGEAWRKGGYKATKPNTWKDFIACTEYLIEKEYTTPDKIACWSESAGGIMIGRAITERPDLYKAAMIEVGVLNTLRSEYGPGGPNNIREYGSVKDFIGFQHLLAMDAYHHIQKGVKYPAQLITAGMNDPRVPPWEPAKFAAKMQQYNASDYPVFLSIKFDGGHGIGETQEARYRETAKVLAFALWQTGHPDYQLKK